MAEPQDPEKPKQLRSPGVPGAPLPRLWKFPSEDDPDDADDSSGKSKKKKKAKLDEAKPLAKPVKKAKNKDAAGFKPGKISKSKGEEGGSKGVLVEETPQFDTAEARQRVRIAVGVGLFSIVMLTGFLIYKVFAPAPETNEDGLTPDLLATSGATGNSREKAEQEALILFRRAAEIARNGKPDLAVALLKRITTTYSSTQVAVEAKQALDRPAQNLPLFLDTPTVMASPPDPKAVADVKKVEPHVVQAVKPAVPKESAEQASLVLPANPPEPAPSAVVNPSPVPGISMKPLPVGFKARQGTVVHPSGWPIEIVGDRDGAPLMLVHGDTFTQGRDEADPSEGPAHQVTLGSYYIDVHEVTVRQFNLFQNESGKRTERARAIAKDPALANATEDEDLPVVMVSARDASDYASWAGKRLPTEAQWEAAARTPDGRIHPWGPNPATWSKPRASRQIDPIRSFPLDASPYGVYDLAGNAWEWTKDWFDPKYYQQFKTSVADNPGGPTVRPKSAQLVIKGSSKEWLVSRREGLRFDTRLPYLGFRCALQVEGPGNVFEPAVKAGQPAANKPVGGQNGNDVPF